MTVFMSAGCYHAVIDTGLAPSGQTISKPWATSFIAGLVPPSVVETASKCPNGVAKVETQHSFLNMLATWITLEIYSPMTITVHCAAARTGMASSDDADMVALPDGTTRDQFEHAMNQAVKTARADGTPVYVSFPKLQ